MRNRLRFAFSVAVAAILLVLFFHRTHPGEVARQIAHVDLLFLCLALVLTVTYTFLRAWRWKVILAGARPVRYFPCFEATTIGAASTTFLPLRAGLLIRPLWLSRHSAVLFSEGLAATVLETILDMATALALFVLYAAWPGWMPRLSGAGAARFRLLTGAAIVAAAGLLGVSLLVFWGARHRGRAERLLAWLAGRMPRCLRPKLESGAMSFLGSLAAIRNGRLFTAAMALSLTMWLTVDLEWWFLYRAFGLRLPFVSTFLIVLVTLLGMAIPTPGGAGGYDKACQIALTFFLGVSIDTATGLTIVAHLLALVPVTVIGLALFAVSPVARRVELRPLRQTPPP